MNNDLRIQMNMEIDKLISMLQLAKNVPGFRTKVNAIDRVMDQVQGFVSYWDVKLDEINEIEIGE